MADNSQRVCGLPGMRHLGDSGFNSTRARQACATGLVALHHCESMFFIGGNCTASGASPPTGVRPRARREYCHCKAAPAQPPRYAWWLKP